DARRGIEILPPDLDDDLADDPADRFEDAIGDRLREVELNAGDFSERFTQLLLEAEPRRAAPPFFLWFELDEKLRVIRPFDLRSVFGASNMDEHLIRLGNGEDFIADRWRVAAR